MASITGEDQRLDVTPSEEAQYRFDAMGIGINVDSPDGIEPKSCPAANDCQVVCLVKTGIRVANNDTGEINAFLFEEVKLEQSYGKHRGVRCDWGTGSLLSTGCCSKNSFFTRCGVAASSSDFSDDPWMGAGPIGIWGKFADE